MVGSAYLYRKAGGTWEQEAELRAADTEPYDDYGATVGLSGETAVIGADRASNANDVMTGSATVFARAGGTWEERATLIPADADSEDHFGRTLAIDGDRILFGTHRDEDPNGKHAESAYVFARTGEQWREQAKLVPDDGDMEDKFGVAVDLDGRTALIGALLDDDPNGDMSGSAYVYGL